MIIFAVDDELLALELLKSTIQKAAPSADVYAFRNMDDTVEAAERLHPDVAFLDINLRAQSGVEVASRLLAFLPRLNVIFVTGYRDYMEDAFRLHVSGYILKPISLSDIQKELNSLRFPVVENRKPKLYVRTFGDFEVFSTRVPLKFSFSKTKELFAILIDKNGGLCSNADIADLLWEDGGGLVSHGSYFQNLLSDLTQTLRKSGCEDPLIRERGYTGIDRTKLECDYYSLLDGNETAAKLFQGKYMTQYSWAEETLAFLVQNVNL